MACKLLACLVLNPLLRMAGFNESEPLKIFRISRSLKPKAAQRLTAYYEVMTW
jgi:hypothetical protein